MTRAQIREKLGVVMLEDPAIANKEMTQEEAEDYKQMMNKVIEYFNEIPKSKSDLLTMETFSQYNRDRKIGHSTYRICRTERKPHRWYIHECYNNIDAGEWARSNGFFTTELEKAIDRINSFTKERQVIDRDREVDT